MTSEYQELENCEMILTADSRNLCFHTVNCITNEQGASVKTNSPPLNA